MSMNPHLSILAEIIAELCGRHRIRKLSLFGSVLRDDFGPYSDLDVLVEFEAGATPGLAFFAIQEELSVLFQRRVDLNTIACLSHYFADDVLKEAEPIYVAA